jgi:hypothetical protein
MSSEKFENLEDDLSSAIDKLRPHVDSISSYTGGKILLHGPFLSLYQFLFSI